MPVEQGKQPPHMGAPDTHSTESDALPFEMVALDFITKLPVSKGYDAILTVTDHDCTKASVFIPCNEEITAEGTAELYIKHVFL